MATRVMASYQLPCLRPTSFSVSSSPANSLCDYELDKQHQQELQEKKTTSGFLYLAKCPPPEAQPCQTTGTVYLEKRTNLPGFRITTLAEKVHRKTALQKRWTNETVSVAAIFSQHDLRVPRLQAFEDGLTN